jgi:hypothetical protein
MLGAVLGLPIIAPQLALDDDLLAFLSQLGQVLCRFSPDSHVYESSDLLALALAIVVELVVSDCSGSDWSTGLGFS